MIKKLDLLIIVVGTPEIRAGCMGTERAGTPGRHALVTHVHLLDRLNHAIHVHHIDLLPRIARGAGERFLVGTQNSALCRRGVAESARYLPENQLVAAGHANGVSAGQGAREPAVEVHAVLAIQALFLDGLLDVGR